MNFNNILVRYITLYPLIIDVGLTIVYGKRGLTQNKKLKTFYQDATPARNKMI